MAFHSRILAWKIPWAGETGRLFSMGPQNWTHLNTHMPVVAYGLCAVFCICIYVHVSYSSEKTEEFSNLLSKQN